MDNYMYLVPVAAVVALLFAAYLANKVSKMDAGTDRMKEIADAIAEGARAFLGAEYKILVIFVAVLFVLIGVGIQNWIEAICFVVGALFSTIAGYCGMTVATKANVRRIIWIQSWCFIYRAFRTCRWRNLYKGSRRWS